MDFQRLLLKVAQALSSEEEQALAFLCKNLVEKDVSSVLTARKLFSLLMDQELLTSEQPYLLPDLLRTIQRNGLIREHGLSQYLPTTSSLICPYRKLLFELSENITQDELRQIKFLLKDDLPRKKLEDNVTTLQVFLEMEKCDILSNHNLHTLTIILESVCPMLKTKIDNFQTQRGPITQETGAGLQRTRSSSEVLPESQRSIQLKRPVSCGPTVFIPELHSSGLCTSTELSSLNSTYTTMDAQRVSDTVNEELSPRLGVLSTSEENRAALVHDNRRVSSTSSHGDNTDPFLADTQTGISKELEEYAMTGSSRGVCLIINNHNFSHSKKYFNNREGTNIDKESLVSVFKWLGFEVVVKSDCSGEQILSLVEELRCRDHSQNDCLVCCILSHGLEGGVYGVDGRELRVRQITEPFSGLMCKSLTGKPKLFFIQACQGIKEQQPVFLQADSGDTEGRTATGSICTDARVPRESIPSDSDFLLGMATIPQFVCFRDKKQGSWFIQSLCQNLISLVPSGHDLLSILTKVNHDVSCMSDENGMKKQMPQPAYSLRKKVVFPNPKNSPPRL
ncbi:caspase-8 [Esox lucius]|uniref:Caspase-8 n=1 Tax=Esox lucius TaxID=8010 RepID=A0A6Q2XBF2_ESOLU|nr:caspase-8 [Esox lucius]